MTTADDYTQQAQALPTAEKTYNAQPVMKKQTVGVRSVKMTVSRIDPLSAVKMCFWCLWQSE
ncbi:hypothetical protein RQN30_07650 [Arcanobacterium hippocoleae]